MFPTKYICEMAPFSQSVFSSNVGFLQSMFPTKDFPKSRLFDNGFSNKGLSTKPYTSRNYFCEHDRSQSNNSAERTSSDRAAQRGKQYKPEGKGVQKGKFLTGNLFLHLLINSSTSGIKSVTY